MNRYLEETFGLTKTGAKGMLSAIVYSFFMFIAYMIPITVLMLFVSDVLAGKIRSLVFYLSLMAGVAVFMFYFINKAYETTYDETYKEAKNIRVKLAQALKKLPLSYYSRHDLSDISQTIMQDVSDIEMAMSHALPQGLAFIVYFVIIIVMSVITKPVLGIALVLPILLSSLFLWFSRKLQMRGAEKYYKRLRENSEIFQEAIELSQEIKSYGLKDKVKADILEAVEDSEKIHIRSEFSQGIPVTMSNAILKLSFASTAFVGISLYTKGEIGLLYLIAYVVASIRIVDAVSSLYENMAVLLYADARINRVKEVYANQIEDGLDIELDSFDIRLENVGFSYKEGTKIIDNLSLDIKQNEVTALIGPSGCGKTTVLRLISKLYDYDEGDIYIGGKSIKKVEAEKLFKYISIVFQDVILFDASIMENIRLGNPNASDEEVLEAARKANCDSFVNALEDGYNTLIGENGAKLSGGERQRISIARAMLKDAPIILLDEISASLDVENEMIIQESLNKLIKGKTVIIISHRLKAIENADNIIVLDKGGLDSQGKHEELLRNSELYRLLTKRADMAGEFVY